MLDPQQLNLYAYVRNNPLALIDPTGMIIDTNELDKKQLERWKKIEAIANAKDKDGNYINAKLHEVFQRLQDDKRTFIIENHSFGDRSSTIGEFHITKFDGDKDFSQAVIQLDFKRLKNLEGPSPADLAPGFQKFAGLFGKHGAELRGAELFGHEGSHGIFALDNVADAVQLEKCSSIATKPWGSEVPIST